MQYLSYVVVAIAAATLGAIGKRFGDTVFEYIRGWFFTSKWPRANLSGDNWCAVWQTTVEGKEVINQEEVTIKRKRGQQLIIENKEKSPDNVKGGYLWRGDVWLHDNKHIIGYYVARESNVVSKGSLYFSLNHNGNFMLGLWVGCNYDSDFTSGFGVIARDRELAEQKMVELKEKPSPEWNKITKKEME